MRGTLILTLAAALAALAASGAAACPGPADGARLTTNRPVQGADVSLAAGFGLRRHPLLNETRMHTGVDWKAPAGTPILAAAAGRVAFAGYKGHYGKTVIIDHGGGLETLYAHLRDIAVREGDCVADGTPLGGLGATGLTVGPALHFEVHRNGAQVDPMRTALAPRSPD